MAGSFDADGDAGVYGTARMRFKNPKLHGKVASYLEGPREGDKPSWKYIRVAASPAALYNGNDLLLNLSDECALDDVSYVKPGKVMRLAKLDTGVAKVWNVILSVDGQRAPRATEITHGIE